MTDHEKLREAIEWVRRDCGWTDKGQEKIDLILAAAESTLPKTKMVEVWRLEYAKRHHVTGHWLAEQICWPSDGFLRNKADELADDPSCACIRVTGPHMQEVPST